jgi:CRP-like cAMP-binding protein
MRKVLFLFGQLNDDDVEWMMRAGRKRSLREGERLIEQRVPVDSVFILLEGGLAVRMRQRNGAEREIARLEAGEIVGEMSFVDSRPPSATVIARKGSTVFALGKAALHAKLAADSGFAARFYRALAIYLSTTVRERHRALEYGSAVPPAEGDGAGDEEDDAGELDAAVLDGVSLAGERFDRMVKRVMAA